MRWKSNRMTAIPPTSTKGLPEIEHAMKDTTKPLPSHPTPENVDESEKEGKAQLQEMSTKLGERQDKPIDATKPLPYNPSPEKLMTLQKKLKLSYKRCPLNLVRTQTSSIQKPKPLSNLPKIRKV